MEQARVAMCRAFDIPLKQSIDVLAPSSIYTLPEVATVGLTEDAARSTGEDVEVGRAFLHRQLARTDRRDDRGPREARLPCLGPPPSRRPHPG
jgi:pyruvate/2-oxoglutarate dehydrogenase complex dihydrolipoamide dehydrogenase (E3) component